MCAGQRINLRYKEEQQQKHIKILNYTLTFRQQYLTIFFIVLGFVSLHSSVHHQLSEISMQLGLMMNHFWKTHGFHSCQERLKYEACTSYFSISTAGFCFHLLSM